MVFRVPCSLFLDFRWVLGSVLSKSQKLISTGAHDWAERRGLALPAPSCFHSPSCSLCIRGRVSPRTFAAGLWALRVTTRELGGLGEVDVSVGILSI